ncbi:MAG TPA: alpha/beta hydrolase [Anaerolineae bacterium]|nr:alpha/beta hydrolase [Anaerolineae bacterium]HQI85834.1 alpha/beta hydrolase [Anaerolineae bacterium]
MFSTQYQRKMVWVWAMCLLVLVGATVVAALVQQDFGRVTVRNVTYANFNGIRVRAKLFQPTGVTEVSPGPGVVYIHGYQNNRETADPYAIELARRGIVVLSIDAIGRGNSGEPNAPDAPDFDPTYGGTTSLAYLKALPFVDATRVGMMGHSLGAEMAYTVALNDPTVQALSISGFAYGEAATPTRPRNMLMIFGRWDEYRTRMTGTRDFAAEWMTTPQTQRAIPVANPEIGVTYGDFANGSARRVYMPHTIHVLESFHPGAIAEAVTWMQQALQPAPELWRDPARQIWPLKEAATLIAMLAGLLSLLPLSWLLLRARFFGSLQSVASGQYQCTGRPFRRAVLVNGLLKWLYIPLIMVLFAVHIYVVPIDGLFPMMMVNGLVWWFLVINLIGLALFWRWRGKQNVPLDDLGVSDHPTRLHLTWAHLGKTALLAFVLFLVVYLLEAGLEALFIVDWRGIFPYLSDLTPYRVGMLALYFPFLLVGFLGTGAFLHGMVRRPSQATWWGTFTHWAATNVLIQIVPLALFIVLQYAPLLLFNVVPLVGPGGVMATFVMTLFQLLLVLALTAVISTWCHLLTGKIYLGALLNALWVAWLLASSQVIAPIPV